MMGEEVGLLAGHLWLDNSGILGGIGKLDIMQTHLITEQKSPFIFNSLFGQLLFSCLHREIGLSKRDDLLVRVGILNDKVAGIAGQKCSFYFSFRTLTD